MTDYDDLLVRVRQSGDPARYTVAVSLQGGRYVQGDAQVTLPSNLQPQDDSPSSLAAFGLDLFNRLFAGQLAQAFREAWTAAIVRDRTLRLRLALDPNAPELHAIPWELLHFDAGGAAPPQPIAVDPRIAFSRYIDSAVFDEGQPIDERPIRMLMVIAAPSDLERWKLTPIDREAEVRNFGARFNAVTVSGQFRFDVLPQATAENLREALTQGALPSTPHRNGSTRESPPRRGYDVLLYYGHALHHPEEGTRLALEHPANGQVKLFADEALIGLLCRLPRSHRPSLVVLVACNSAASGRLNSLAARLVIESGIPAVVAMQRLVEIALARSFTFHLIEHLLRDGIIDVAVNAARRRVFQSDSASWSTPVLYMRNPSGRLFHPNAHLEHAAQVLRDEEILRWSGSEFIESSVRSVPPGQDWTLLRQRPEEAPTAISALDAFDQLLGLGLRTDRRQRVGEGERSTNLIVLIGPPQAGHTTLLRRLTFELASAVQQDVGRPLGIYITLNGYDQMRGAGRLERFLIEQARTVTPHLGEALSALFFPTAGAARTTARYIFLLDNLDALADRARIDLAQAVADLAHRYPDQGFVLASTADLYPDKLLSEAWVLALQPLTERQILRYCRQRNEEAGYRIYRRIQENRLLSLTTEPSLLALIYNRLAADPQIRLTRIQVVQEYLDRRLAGLPSEFRNGNAARDSLAELAWHGRWNHREHLSLDEVFSIFRQVRRERDYSLETLFALLRDARLLTSVGAHQVRLANPILYAYLAALALIGSREAPKRMADIVTLCASPERFAWWEDVIYALAGLLANPTPLFEQLAEAVRAGSTTHALLAARCLEAISPEQERRLDPALRMELLDACTLRLRSDREPSAERREQLVAALGRLNCHQVIPELRRILTERVRKTPSGPRYEYTNVRIVAARALRSLYTASRLSAPTVHDAHSHRTIQEQRDEAMLRRIIGLWNQGAQGRNELRAIIQESPSPPERALAVFALADLDDREEAKLRDARYLLRVIIGPADDAHTVFSEEWEDTIWAAADALTLFEPDQLAPLLALLVRRKESIPDQAAQQLAYLAGRVRATDPELIDWLIEILIVNRSQSVKAKALQSLAWIGAAEKVLELPDGRPGPTVKQIIQDIAAWRMIPQLKIGVFEVDARPGDGEHGPLYLRRKAIEALAWIGDAATLNDLRAQFPSWPLELREHWYLAAAQIANRTVMSRV